MKTNLESSPRRTQLPNHDPKLFPSFSSLLENIKTEQRQETLLLKNLVAEAIHNLQNISDPFEHKKRKRSNPSLRCPSLNFRIKKSTGKTY